MENKASLIHVLEVPLKGGDGYYSYEKIKYLSNHRWTDDEKLRIERAIDKLQNSTDPVGEEKIVTSNGEMEIKCKIHPEDGKKRMKLVQGFIRQVVSDDHLSVEPFSLISFLKDMMPDFMKDSKEAAQYLGAIEELIKNSELASDCSKFYIFNSLLQVLVENKVQYTVDEKAAERLIGNINNIRSLYPDK